MTAAMMGHQTAENWAAQMVDSMVELMVELTAGPSATSLADYLVQPKVTRMADR